MASRYPETDNTTPFSSPTINASTDLEEFDKTEREINSHFNWLHQILKDRNKAILDKLREKKAEFIELEADRVGQIEEIETMKQQMLNVGVKFNKTNVLRDKSIRDYNDALNESKIPIQPQKIIFEKFADRFHTLISSIDLKFVEEDYRARINPIISKDNDSIIKTINSFENEKLLEPKLEEDLVIAEKPIDGGKKELKKVDLSKLAFDSETNCLFVINKESDNILVFQQDGTLIACFGEEFKNLTDLCIDNNNKFLYVLDSPNCIHKFNLTTYQLLKKKENEIIDIKNAMSCLDIHNDEIYVGTLNDGIYIFNSEFEHIRCISTLTICCLDIICRDEDILIFSFFPSGLNIYSYNGDLIRNNILHFFVLRINHIDMLEDIQFNPFQLSLDKNGLILFSNPFDNCLYIQTSGGYLVHKIYILPQEEKNTFIAGVASTNDGRIFVTVSNSKYPLRCY